MKTENLVIRISPDLKKQIKLAADSEGKTISEWVLDIVKFELRTLKIMDDLTGYHNGGKYNGF